MLIDGSPPYHAGTTGPVGGKGHVTDIEEIPVPPIVMLLRHAEKPLGDGPPRGVTIDGTPDLESLTPRGWQRGGGNALAHLSADA